MNTMIGAQVLEPLRGRKLKPGAQPVEMWRNRWCEYPVYRTEDIIPRKPRKVIPTTILEPTQDNIGAALFEINKAAKRRRDAGKHTDKDELYSLKTRTIAKATKLGMAFLDGYHKTNTTRIERDRIYECSGTDICDCEEECGDRCHYDIVEREVPLTLYFALHRIGDWRFHQPVSEAPENALDLGKNWLSSAAKCGTQMRLKDAIATLNAFLEQP